MIKKMLFLVIVLSGFACQRDYNCVCTRASSHHDTLLEHIKTTKLGSKGYEKTCLANEQKDPGLSNCRIL